jgi:terminase large subunit-like protein
VALYPHTIGVDLGQSRDFTSVAVLQEAYWLTERQAWSMGLPEEAGWVWPSQLPSPATIDDARSWNYYNGRPPNPPLALVHLDRYELHTPYPEIVTRIGALIGTPPLRLHCTPLVVDGTGVGAPVVDMLRQAGLGPTSVTITSGFTVICDQEDGSYRVPKRDLVSTMSVLLESRRLRIPRTLPIADLLDRELQEFRRTVTKVGNDTYAAERDQHDDMVLSIALAAWHREFVNGLIERQNATNAQQAAAVAAFEERANRLAIANAQAGRGGV